MKKFLAWIGLVAVAFAIFYVACVHYTDQYQVAIAWNHVTGKLWLDGVPGFNITPPWVRVTRIDTRPVRVCITSVARSYNCKLVQFEPRAYREFVQVQGFGYYWLANRLSFNFGYDDEYRGMRDILRGYSFSGRSYPFVTTLREYQDSPN